MPTDPVYPHWGTLKDNGTVENIKRGGGMKEKEEKARKWKGKQQRKGTSTIQRLHNSMEKAFSIFHL